MSRDHSRRSLTGRSSSRQASRPSSSRFNLRPNTVVSKKYQAQNERSLREKGIDDFEDFRNFRERRNIKKLNKKASQRKAVPKRRKLNDSFSDEEDYQSFEDSSRAYN
jgi:hypothetical protein